MCESVIIVIGVRFWIRRCVSTLWGKCGTGAGIWVAFTDVWWGPVWLLFSLTMTSCSSRHLFRPTAWVNA